MMSNLHTKKAKQEINYVTVSVSVIIATYRRDESLKKAIESVINQTYDSVEIIVVDDNADARWNKIVEDVIKPFNTIFPIKYIQNRINKGSAETRNIGIKSAKGEYITFLDDDDIYLPNKIKNQVKHMLEKGSDYSITDLNLFAESGKLIERRKRNYIKEFSKDSLLKYHLMYHITGTDTMMFKKDYLLSIGGFLPINVGDEFYLMQKAIESGGKFSYLPGCYVKAVVHSSSEGLSSGTSKIEGENKLFEYKKDYFHLLNSNEKKYVTMRHYAVLAFAEVRRRNYSNFIRYAVKSFITSPFTCIRLLIKL